MIPSRLDQNISWATEEVRVGDVVVMGRTGKLDFSIDKVGAGILTASAAIVFWPAAPAFLLMKGKDVTLHKGMAFEVFTDSDFKMSPPCSPGCVCCSSACCGSRHGHGSHHEGCARR